MIGRSARSLVLLTVAAFLGIILLYVAFAVFGVQALFFDDRVDEDFAAAEEPVAREETTVGEQPSGFPVQISSGQFHAVEHAGTGDATVYQQEDGSYMLRLENFDVENGPDLYVYAVAAEDANDVDTVLDSGFLDLGKLKGNQGDQSYDLPAGFDPEVHRAISVWCKRFTANFAAAPLR